MLEYKYYGGKMTNICPKTQTYDIHKLMFCGCQDFNNNTYQSTNLYYPEVKT